MTILFLPVASFAHTKHEHHKSHELNRRHKHHHHHPEVMKIDPTKFEEIKCMAMNAYFESDNGLDEMFESQFMVAYVTSQRANKGKIELLFEKLFGGKTLCTVTYARVQFSWTIARFCPSCRKWIKLQDAPHGFKWESAQFAAQMVLDGWRPEDIGLDPMFDRALYYFNPNPKLTKPRMACKFRQAYVRLAKGKLVGGHEFYAIPKDDIERRMLVEAHKDKVNKCVPVDTLTVEAKTP